MGRVQPKGLHAKHSPFRTETSSYAIPTMHRLLLRMGSFSYQNDPEKLLTLGVLRTACIFLNKDSGDLGGNSSFGIILFQSLASLDSVPDRSEAQDDDRPRNETDDYHLKSSNN